MDTYKYTVMALSGNNSILAEDYKKLKLPVPAEGSLNMVFNPQSTKKGIIIQCKSTYSPLYMKVKVRGRDKKTKKMRKIYLERDTSLVESLIITSSIIGN